MINMINMIICNICEENLPEESFYKKGDGRFTTCIQCTKAKKKKQSDIKYNVETAAHIFKVFSNRGFHSQEELNEYRIVEEDYLAQTGRTLPKLNKRIKRNVTK